MVTFIFFQAYPDGKMTKKDFLFENMSSKGGPIDFWNQVFNLLDVNNSGFLEIKDVLSINSSLNEDNFEQKAIYLFLLFDKEKSGSLKEENLKDLLRTILLLTTKDDLELKITTYLSKYEKDQTSKISFTEFLKKTKGEVELNELVNYFCNQVYFDIEFNKKRSKSIEISSFNQVAGHSGGIKSIIKKEKKIWKPLNQTEYEFYEEVHKNKDSNDFYKELASFMVFYDGRTFVDYTDQEEINQIVHYIILEDLTYSMKKPCIIDLKMGTREYSDDDSTKKKVQKFILSNVTASNSLGFRICGMKVWREKENGYGTENKKKALLLNQTQIEDSLIAFIDNGNEIKKKIYTSVIQQLSKILKWFEKNDTYCFYASSILIIYDGVDPETPVLVKMIDFAHTQKNPKKKTRDESYITGIKNLIEILTQIISKPQYKKDLKGILSLPESGELLKIPESDEYIKKLNIKLLKGTDFPACNLSGVADLFCQVHVGRLKQKTETQMSTLNPVWNQQLDFDVENEPVKEISIEIIHWTLTSTEVISSINIEPSEIEYEKKYRVNVIPNNKQSFKGNTFLEFIFYYNRASGKEVSKSKKSNISNFLKKVKGNKKELYFAFLKNVELLKSMDDNERWVVANAVKKKKFKQGEDIIKQGDKGDEFHIIIEGQCKVWRTHEGKRYDLVTLKKEAYFGELALLFDQPRAATVTAETKVKTISLDLDSFKLLLGSIEEILKRNTENYESYMKKINVKSSSNPIPIQSNVPVLNLKMNKDEKRLSFSPQNHSLSPDKFRPKTPSSSEDNFEDPSDDDDLTSMRRNSDVQPTPTTPDISNFDEKRMSTSFLSPIKYNNEKKGDLKPIKKPNSDQNIKMLNVKLIKGSGIPVLNGSTADTFCVVKCGSQKLKSEVKFATLNPVWNQQLDFNVEKDLFNEVMIEIYHWSLTKSELIGTIVIPSIELQFDKKISMKMIPKKESFKEEVVIEFIFYFDKEDKSTSRNSTVSNLYQKLKGNNVELYSAFLKKVALFQSMNDNERMIIASAVRENKFNKGEDIIKQGEKGDEFHVIIEGQCKVWKVQDGKRLDLVTLRKESYFGELALLFDQPRAATVTADSILKTISLDLDSFKLLLGPVDDILKRNTANYEMYMKKKEEKKIGMKNIEDILSMYHEGERIPILLKQCSIILTSSKELLMTEGLFRESTGYKEIMEQIQEYISVTKDNHVTEYERLYQKISSYKGLFLSTLYRNFINSIEEPIIIESYYETYVKLAQIPENDKLPAFESLLEKISPQRRDLLNAISFLMNEISLVNEKMKIGNLAKVMTPGICRKKETKLDDYKDFFALEKSTAFIFENYLKLFHKSEDHELIKSIFGNMYGSRINNYMIVEEPVQEEIKESPKPKITKIEPNVAPINGKMIVKLSIENINTIDFKLENIIIYFGSLKIKEDIFMNQRMIICSTPIIESSQEVTIGFSLDKGKNMNSTNLKFNFVQNNEEGHKKMIECLFKN